MFVLNLEPETCVSTRYIYYATVMRMCVEWVQIYFQRFYFLFFVCINCTEIGISSLFFSYHIDNISFLGLTRISDQFSTAISQRREKASINRLRVLEKSSQNNLHYIQVVFLFFFFLQVVYLGCHCLLTYVSHQDFSASVSYLHNGKSNEKLQIAEHRLLVG